jgi:prepilin-type N-terminal cleavage/methylation domain-containing protein
LFSTRQGFTLIELMVALTVMALTASFAVPRFQKALEQTRVDLSASNLESLWTAQRLYLAQNHTFASSIEVLKESNLLDATFPATDVGSYFVYVVTSADATGFNASAQRVNSAHWSGGLTISEQGVVTGGISGTSGEWLTALQS